ncbi:P-loop containing nucleoside triphosphate hydrolase protein [Massarina eburnea CBS 473.64]|uniref:P-loop containing nucleoside triphosphate hydrolase protein n=1 Tax=Massarina eburnea CBS 473.64 TaxID=1395130 RepID=A0A6A6RQ98_9PLEO|nr:P-loop containing nucleoside triphosphate hydrolase protein [Massarina eburnea CBS 473.64]
MADQTTAEKRLVGLTKLFNAVIHSHRDLKRLEDGVRFLEALYSQPSTSICLENLIASSGGVQAVSNAFRFSGDNSFLNGTATSTLRFLSHPTAKQIYNGQFLNRILVAIVQPPTFWNTFVEAHHSRTLTDEGTLSFAWLLLELVSSRSEELPDDVRDVAERITDDESFIKSEVQDVRNLGHKIKHVLESTSSNTADGGPGGRHDNDHVDFRKVKIMPTTDEFESTEKPFYRQADAFESEELGRRGQVHLDNQFRLLREDLLGELRNDYQTAIGAKKGRKKVVIKNLEFSGIHCGAANRRQHCSIKLRCNKGIPQLASFKGVEQRKAHIIGSKNFLKHQSLGCLISDGHIVAFASVDRDVDELAADPPTIVLRIADETSFKKVLISSTYSKDLAFVQVDTAVFAYEPILKCLQDMQEVPLQEQLLNTTPDSSEVLSGIQPTQIFDTIRQNREEDLQHILGTTRSVKLDDAQADSLLAGISKRVSLIQGPPGTGKSFIGALIAKILHDDTSETMLVQTFTNHALDQFLEDLQNIGIPSESIVRLGHKTDPKNKALSIFEQPITYRMNGPTYNILQDQKSQSEEYHNVLAKKITRFQQQRLNNQELLDYLEFSEDSEYFDAFQVPDRDDDMKVIGKVGNQINTYYLLDQWMAGNGAGIFQSHVEDFATVWALKREERKVLYNRWMREIIEERVAEIGHLVYLYNQCRHKIDQLNRQKFSHIMRTKRIIGCTTTAAAKHADEIQRASPGIVIVEEAGEILESHVLTAMSPNTKQLVLIGDHKQLRPKVNNYSLTIEKGDGYNLNQSLFERLVLSGVPHITLNLQHRMRGEISNLVRSLTYPELEDAPTTKDRPALRGFQDNVIFVSHDHLELNASQIADRRDEGANSSKENEYEVDMVLKCVRYLGQQGYGTDQIVILTPYLGQLYRLLRTLAGDNDPILNDLDSFELTRAGLLSSAGANVSKRKIKISTIDNYQGEESDIVIASLTRSNTLGDIGFMSSPQRVNVLLSRARNALIMIGNADTFMDSRKGKEVWVPLMDQMKQEGHIYNGFPVQCEKHPGKKALLTTSEAFDTECPDGGCAEPCDTLLNCGEHTCPRRCHQLTDHSKMQCNAIVEVICPKNHKRSKRCYEKQKKTCRKCEDETKAAEKRRRRDWELDQKQQTKQRAYAEELAAIDDEIEHEKRAMKTQAGDNDRSNALAQKKRDLANLKKARASGLAPAPQDTNASTSRAAGSDDATSSASPPSQVSGSQSSNPNRVSDTSANSSTSTQVSDTSANSPTTSSKAPPGWDHSQARDEWDWQKTYEGADNEALDALMDMTGLESVKEKFLAIKTKVDTVVRQNVSLTGERFGAALLGNPGTGKTTVARLYAKFLVKVGALPGDHFIESSGSSLANDGVSACKDHIEKILGAGGGVFFIDEAYQLVSGNSPGGKAVLDFLLAEMENLTGKVVFVLAGYHKQMEAFFAHNPGIPSRIPIRMEFQDYTDQELQHIFIGYIEKKYRRLMKVEDGMYGLYVRIVARRIGRGRGREGFGNARDVQNKIAHITERQAKRLRKERKTGKLPDDYLLTKEDLIGPEPTVALKNNAAWNTLQKMIGLTSVKDSIKIFLDQIQFNYQRELTEKPLVQYSLNKCFIGSPGTGKTSVAKLYGRILADLGLLSNGEVVVKNPADFIGDVIGASETKTKAVLASSIGKVLIIDEAYMLAGGGKPDVFKIAVIDTIVAEVQSTPGEDRCVLLLGYKDQMEEMFRDTNPGLARRFPLDSSFVFQDFTDAELRRILDLKLKDIGYSSTDQAKKVAIEILQRARNRPNFGNAGEVDIILDRAKALHQQHLTSRKVKQLDTFEAIDFDPDFERASRAATNLPQLFQDVIGCEDLIKQIQGYQTTVANMKALDMDPREQIPFNFLFKGPPGTGKTTTAQKMGKVFYDMGFLSEAKVIECSATDMIGQYVGHTGPKVQQLLEKALGKVLFIDEAYRLGDSGGSGHNSFATEAMDELVDCLTKPKYANKLICILAGYDKDIDRLMSMNPGLTSRFPESIIFPPLDPKTSLTLLTKTLQKQSQKAPLNVNCLIRPVPGFEKELLDRFTKFSKLDSWGNARDVKSLAKVMFRKLISNAIPPITSLVLTENTVLQAMDTTLTERSRRNEAVGTTRRGARKPSPSLPPHQQQQPPQTSTKTDMNANKSTKNAPQPPPDKNGNPKPQEPPSAPHQNSTSIEEPEWIDSILKVKRDPGVSDAVWEQLNIDKHAAIVREREYLALQKKKREEAQRIEDLKRAEENALHEAEKRRWEKERIEAELERRKQEAILAEVEKKMEKARRQQQRIRELGPCPMGYRWIKQSGGYRCAGGSHWLPDSALGV